MREGNIDMKELLAKFYGVRPNKGAKLHPSGTYIAVQRLYVLNLYVECCFEAYRPGASLTAAKLQHPGLGSQRQRLRLSGSESIAETIGPELSGHKHIVYAIADPDIIGVGPHLWHSTLSLIFSDGCAITFRLDELPDFSIEPNQTSLDSFLWNSLKEKDSGTFLEIGGRGHSSVPHRALIPPGWKYLACDVQDGVNVDIVADAHKLSQHLKPESVDVAYSVAVFEHLAAPWKVAIEINRVLKIGGIAYIVTHNAWPLHEEPWDFWRFTPFCWQSLFNKATGFEIIRAATGDLCRVLPEVARLHTLHLPVEGRAYLSVAVLACKIGGPTVDWQGYRSEEIFGVYPD
jgi:hypothetical protein